jgi:predicted ArsR family transcriptional regulator
MDDGTAMDPWVRRLQVLDLPLERDTFVRTVLRHLVGTLQDVVGLEEASGFIAVVGQEMGQELGAMIRDRLGVDGLTAEQVSAVLIELKRRVMGDFYLVEQSDDAIVLGNRVCPFGEQVRGRPALCMMTSNVFGSIAAQALGYAKVELQETIAHGAPGCRVRVHLRQTPAADQVDGYEYFRGVEE